jgi:hypothetical protein
MVRRMILVGHSYVKRLQNFCDSYLCNFGFSERDADVFYVALDSATLIEGLTCRRMYLSDVAALNPYIYVGENNLRALPVFLLSLFIVTVSLLIHWAVTLAYSRPHSVVAISLWNAFPCYPDSLQTVISLNQNIQQRLLHYLFSLLFSIAIVTFLFQGLFFRLCSSGLL